MTLWDQPDFPPIGIEVLLFKIVFGVLKSIFCREVVAFDLRGSFIGGSSYCNKANVQLASDTRSMSDDCLPYGIVTYTDGVVHASRNFVELFLSVNFFVRKRSRILAPIM